MHRSIIVRLAAFVLVIAGSFGTSYAVGRRLPGNPESRPHTHGAPVASAVPPGFAADGYVLVTEATQPSATSLAMHINGPDGRRITDFTEAHGSKLHLVLVRFDLSGFEHLHPDINVDGSFVVPIDKPGKWHIVVDSQPTGATTSVTLATNVDDEKPVDQVALPKPLDTVQVDDLTVVRNGLNLTVTGKGGAAATGLEPFLGQPAHLIAIRQGDLAYNHLHPVTGSSATFSFAGQLASGTYRLFLQFGYKGEVRTVPFTVVQP